MNTAQTHLALILSSLGLLFRATTRGVLSRAPSRNVISRTKARGVLFGATTSRNVISRATTRGVLVLATLTAAALLVASPAGAVEIERVKSPGGIEAWLVRDQINPIISLRFAFRGGAVTDPVGKEGLASMASSLLDEGAGDIDSMAFQRKLSDLSITLRFEAGQDNISGRLTTLTETSAEAFRLLELAVTQPRFDEEPVNRIRKQILVGLRRSSEDPGSIAGKALFKILYPSHPYGRPVGGTTETVTGLTLADLRQFARKRLARDNLIVGVVGDITAPQLATMLDKVFGGLPQKSEPVNVPEVVAKGGGKSIVIRKPVPQSTIQFAQIGVKRKHPDFYPTYVMNHILGGGGFTSRLYGEVREKRGLAYSVYSGLYTLDRSALITGGAGTANARVGETLSVLKEQWRRMAADGVTEAELVDAKTYMTGSFPLRFTSSGRIAGMLVGMQLEDLGIDYFETRNRQVESVTLKDVNRIAKHLINEKNLTVVVVGDPKGVEATP